MRREFLKYNPKLRTTARMLRKHSTPACRNALRRAGTLAEILLWNELKGKKILGCDFHRQKPIGNYIVDFFCPRLMLAVEIDGASHLDKIEEDKKRQKELELLGIRFVRFRDEEIKCDLGGVVEAIKQWILEERQHEA